MHLLKVGPSELPAAGGLHTAFAVPRRRGDLLGIRRHRADRPDLAPVMGRPASCPIDVMPPSVLALHGARSNLAVLAFAGVVALVLGVLTAYAQGWLPEQVSSLANSSGAWALIAFGLCLLARRLAIAVACGVVALLALLLGYVLGAQSQGFASSRSLLIFWGLAAVFAGPLIGVCAHWTRYGRPVLAALGTGGVAGVLVGKVSTGCATSRRRPTRPIGGCRSRSGSSRWRW